MGLDHKSLAVGIVVGYFVLPMVLGAIASKRGAKKA